MATNTKNRPLTIREIQARKKAQRDSDLKRIRIRNKSKTQNIPIQLYGKKGNDVVKHAINQISIQIGPNRHVDLPEYRLIPEQIATLKKRGLITTSRVGPSGSNIKETDYRQFLNNIKVEKKVNLSKNGKATKNVAKKKDKSKSKNKTKTAD